MVGRMCTLIFGWNALGPGTLMLGANRDEDPNRPARGPRRLRENPPVAGGQDLRAGGTWLAVRERRCVVAVLNRRDPAPKPRRPSRGWLAIAAAAAGDGHPRHCAEAARLMLAGDPYAPCSLVVAGPEAAFVVVHRGDGPPSIETVAAGWHAIAHQELDDPKEPRIAWLTRELAEFRPGSEAEADARLGAWLASHGGATPAVCIHEGAARTVSTSRLWLASGAARYTHGEGLACRAEMQDFSDLL
jgi:hypothetical protein